MTTQLHDLDRRIDSAEELHTITRTMRGLAAVNVHHYERAARSASAYEDVIEEGLHVALRDGGLDRLRIADPDLDAPTAMIVFGSNQGLCGPVNRHVADRASTEARRWPTLVHVGAVGARLDAELELLGIATDARWDLPGVVETIVPRAEQVLLRADAWREHEGVQRVVVVFPEFLGRTRGHEPTAEQLAPTDRAWLHRIARRTWESKVLPSTFSPWDPLVAGLIRRAMFVRLHRNFAHTMASVAASRFTAMEAAQHDIEERLEQLRRLHQRLRHDQITDELLDVQSGFEVLTTD